MQHPIVLSALPPLKIMRLMMAAVITGLVPDLSGNRKSSAQYQLRRFAFTTRYTESMRVALLTTGVLFFVFSCVLCAGTVHVIGSENIPKLMASSDLVCKGEVVEAPEPVFSTALELPPRTATAIVRADRCFKGQPPANQFLPVLFDHILPSGGTTGGRIYVVFRKGEGRASTACIFSSRRETSTS
jgi:hypothetical protein